jgi:hypothetical protein
MSPAGGEFLEEPARGYGLTGVAGGETGMWTLKVTSR